MRARIKDILLPHFTSSKITRKQLPISFTLKTPAGNCTTMPQPSKHQHFVSCAVASQIVNLVKNPWQIQPETEEIPATVEAEQSSGVLEEDPVETETNVQVDNSDHVQAEIQAQVEAENLEQMRDREYLNITLNKVMKVIRDGPDAGKDPEYDLFVKTLAGVFKKTSIPQRDKLKVVTKRTHTPIKEIMGDFRKKIAAKRRGRKKAVGQGDQANEEKPPDDLVWKNIIEDAPLEDIEHPSWSWVLTLTEEKIYSTVKKYFDEPKQKAFFTALDKAKVNWDCAKCHTYSSKLMKTDFIECNNCNSWMVSDFTV